MEKLQRDALRDALMLHNYSVGRVAAQLRIGRSTVYRLMKRYGLGAPDHLAASVHEDMEAKLPSPSRRRTSESKVVFDGINYVLVKQE